MYYSSSDRAINIIKDEKEKKLLNAQSVVNLKLSSDEKYLAITKLSNLYSYETFIYDLENEKYLKNNFSSFRNPIFASYQGRKLIIGLSSEQNKQTIQYFYLDEDENTKNKEKDNNKTNDNEESKWIYFSDIEILDILEKLL